MSNSVYLFVYGTLMKHFDNEFAIFLRNNSEYIDKGFFNGLLFNLGEYTGAIYIEKIDKKVYGNVFKIIFNSDNIFHILDEYEEVGDNFEQPNEYCRRAITIQIADKKLECWVYLYNREVNFKDIIESGDDI